MICYIFVNRNFLLFFLLQALQQLSFWYDATFINHLLCNVLLCQCHFIRGQNRAYYS